jgi:two-component system invasion response regulator UvrY
VAPLGSVTPTVRVLVVDDQLAFHDVAHAVIDATAGFEWIGGASSGEDGVESVERLAPDLVLMDVRMPGIGGLEAARRIASGGLRAIVVLVTATPLPGDGGRGYAAEIVAKEALCGGLLRRLWEDYGQSPARRELAQPEVSSLPAPSSVGLDLTEASTKSARSQLS